MFKCFKYISVKCLDDTDFMPGLVGRVEVFRNMLLLFRNSLFYGAFFYPVALLKRVSIIGPLSYPGGQGPLRHRYRSPREWRVFFVSESLFPGYYEEISIVLKVLQVINSLSSGGAEVFVAQLVNALSSSCEVKLLSYAGELDQKGISLKEYLKNNNVQYIPLNADSVLKRMIAPLRIASEIDKWKPDIVHVHMIRSEQFVFLSSLVSRHAFKAIRTKHDERLYPGSVMNGFMKKFYDRNIACSDSAFSALRSMGLSDRSIVIKNGIETGSIKKFDAEEKLNMREKLGISEGKVMLLNVGSMQLEETGFQKSQDLVISALGVDDMVDRCHVVFLGDGSGKDILKQQAVSSGIENSITFKGVVPNVMDYVACADAMLMPSRWEGLPIAAIEGACSGLPMVLSDIESFDEFDSKAVVKCEVGSVDSLVSALKEVLSRLSGLKEEAIKASTDYRRRFSIQNVAAKHVEVYKDVLISS